LDLIESFVKSQGWEYSRLDGHTFDRVELVNAFNKSGTNLIFLISTKAGGTGLNLQSASNVILFDTNWNPSWDMQAQDRAYRYGNDQKVSVYRMISRGTVEEIVYMRQLYKINLQHVALSVTEKKIRKADGFEEYTMFEGVDGDSSCRGELFGMENILQYHDGSILQSLREKYRLEALIPCNIPSS
jgi:SNF2 family DNA or RNA helicase